MNRFTHPALIAMHALFQFTELREERRSPCGNYSSVYTRSEEDAHHIHAATRLARCEKKQARKAAKRAYAYTRCINNNPCLS